MTDNKVRFDRQLIRHTVTWIVFLLLIYVIYILAANDIQALRFDEDPFMNIGRILSPLLLIALFIERAVEVIVAPLRGEVSDKLEMQIKKAPNQKAAEEYRIKLNEYRAGTRWYAFGVGLVIGITAAMVGVRALQNLILNGDMVNSAFAYFDIVLTGLILAGGADGIHKIVTAFTDYAEMISRKAKENANGKNSNS